MTNWEITIQVELHLYKLMVNYVHIDKDKFMTQNFLKRFECKYVNKHTNLF